MADYYPLIAKAVVGQSSAETRRTLYPAILIDLRELDALSSSGLSALATWSTDTPWPPTVSALRDTRTTSALATAGLSGTIPFAQPA